jgi:hypothetical protein
VACGLLLATCGCTPETFQQIHISVKPSEVLSQPPIMEAVQQAARSGAQLAGTAILLLGIYLWYKAYQGQPWITIIKESVWGAVVCAFLLGTSGSFVKGPAIWIYNTGQWLGTAFGPPDGYMQTAFRGLLDNEWALFSAMNQPHDDASLGGVRIAQALSAFATTVNGAQAILLNTLGSWFVKELASLAYVYLMALYWVLLPLVAWTAILPTTRNVVIGWFKCYISIALWPLFWAIADRINLALFASAGFGLRGVTASGDFLEMAKALAQAQTMFLLFNVATVLIYATIPVASYKIVSGASDSMTSLWK